MRISGTLQRALAIAAFCSMGANAEGPDWSASAGSTLEAGESSSNRTFDASVTPTFLLWEDWSVAPTLAWSTTQSSLADSLAHSLVPSVSVDWFPLDHLVVSAGGWISALEDPLDEGASLGISAHGEVLDGLTLRGGLTGGWSESAQWFASLGTGVKATRGMVRVGISGDLTYATVPVSNGRMGTKSLYTFQTGASGFLDLVAGPVTLGPDLSWNGYSYDKKPGKNATTNQMGMTRPALSGSHSEWYAGAHLAWKAFEWLSVNGSGGRRWTDDQSSIDATTRMNKQGKVVVSSSPALSDATVDEAAISLDFSW